MFPVIASLLLAENLSQPTQHPRLEWPASTSATVTNSPQGPLVGQLVVAEKGQQAMTAPKTVKPVLQPAPPAVMTEIFQSQEVRPLPGQLDKVPVFNSNSPEMVRSEGILLSTFPPQGKRSPGAHLNYPLQGRFDVFAHHLTQANRPNDLTTLYLGILLYNPSPSTVTVNIQQAASFLSTPDAPFRNLPALVDNPIGYVFSGPGSRVMNQVLRGRRQNYFPAQIVIPPGESRMLVNLPIPVPKLKLARFQPPAAAQLLVNQLGEIQPLAPLMDGFSIPNQIPSSNGRSTFMQLQSNGPVYAASMAMYSRFSPDGTERVPALQDWQAMLTNGRLASPRDTAPTPPDRNSVRMYYGRVAGVSQGSSWQAKLTDKPNSIDLTIPRLGQSFSYGISTLPRGTFGTGQVQSAPMLVRYPDTAYFAHGNYGVHYNLSLPLHNSTPQLQTVAVSVQTPLNQDQLRAGLDFLNPPAPQVFFRGTVRVDFNDDFGQNQLRYVHLVQRRGQRGEPLTTVNLQPGERRNVEVDFLYPPDATPPQVLTVSTLLGANMVTTQKPLQVNSPGDQLSRN
jgi:Protein of unknown function (DUF3370)